MQSCARRVAASETRLPPDSELPPDAPLLRVVLMVILRGQRMPADRGRLLPAPEAMVDAGVGGNFPRLMDRVENRVARLRQ